MANAAPRTPLTYADYLVLERSSSEKHEFADGERFAMAGGKRAHNAAAANVIGLLHAALRRKPCVVFQSDMRVRTGDDVATYPDVSVACGALRFSDETEDELRNPVLIVEVLSDSTEAYDRGEKLAHYLTIDSLRDVVFVATKVARVDHYTRQDDGSWARRSSEPGGAVRIPSLDVSLPVDDIYDKVFPAADQPA